MHKNVFLKQLLFLTLLFGNLFSQQNLEIFSSDSIASVSFSFVGDLMCHSSQFNSAWNDSTQTYNFNSIFDEIRGLISKSDLSFGNLETVTAGKEIGYKGYPIFNTPDEYITALKNVGFDFLFTSNNHAVDQYEIGVKRTIEIINKNQMKNIGTQKKGNPRFQIVEINNIRLAIISFTFGTNGFFLDDTSKYEVNVVSRKIIREELGKMKLENPDVTLVYFHYGTEYEKKPSDYQTDYTNYAFRYGADIVIGSHPHVMQPIEFSKRASIKNSFVAYSLGNFISNQQWRFSDSGVILNFSINKNLNTNEVWVEDLHYFPTWVYKGIIKQKEQDFLILPEMNEYSVNLDSTKRRLIKQSFEDTRKILSGETEIE